MKDTIVLVESYPETSAIWAEFLSKLGWRVIVATNLDDGDTAIKSEIERLRLVLCADWMGGHGINGPDLYQQRMVDLDINQVPFVLLVTYRGHGFVEYVESLGMKVLRRPCSLQLLQKYLRVLLGSESLVP